MTQGELRVTGSIADTTIAPGDSIEVRAPGGALLGYLKYFSPEEAEHVVALDLLARKRTRDAIEFRVGRLSPAEIEEAARG